MATKMIFAHFDGDDVGPALELLLLDNLPQRAREYSEAVREAFDVLCQILAQNPDVKVIVAGGDDLVASWPEGSVEISKLEELRSSFHKTCGRTMSIGVGTSTTEAVHNLHRAKLMGKDQVVVPTVMAD